MSVRRAVALALSAALGITGLAAAAPAATAAPDSPYEATVAAPPSSVPPARRLLDAGTGLQSYNPVTEKLEWQSLADGRTTAPRDLCDSLVGIVFQGDRFGCFSSHHDTGTATVHDWTTGETLTRELPAGHRWIEILGGANRLLTSSTDAEGTTTLHLLGLGPGAPEDIAVRMPESAVGRPGILGYDARGAVVEYQRATGDKGLVVLDFATGALTALPDLPAWPLGYVFAGLSADRVVVYGLSSASSVFVIPRGGGPVTTVKLPDGGDAHHGRAALLGDWMVSHYGPLDGTRPVRATSLVTGETRSLGFSTVVGYEMAVGADGGLYLEGGTDLGHWGVRRVAPGAAGAPVSTQVLALPSRTVDRVGLTLANGLLTAGHEDFGKRSAVRYEISPTEPRTVTDRWSCDAGTGTGTTSNCPPSGAADVGSTWWADTGDGRLVTLFTEDIPPFRGDPPCIGCVITARVTTPGPGGGTRSVKLDTDRRISPVRVLGAAGRYLHFLATENYETRSVVADVETGKVLSVSDRTNQALWGSWLWTSSTANDTVSAVDLRTGATVATVDLGTDCGVFDFDVVGKWIYARCGDGTSAVVYDREKKAPVRFQVSRYAQPRLGDGFVAHTVPGGGADDALSVTDVRSGAPVVRALGGVASSLPNYGQGWTVDRFGGGVAFVDSRRTIHVVGLGGATSRLAVTDSAVPASVNLKSSGWQPRWNLSKPGTWKLTLTHRASGKSVRTLAGEGRGVAAPVWDGRDGAGKYVANGAYAWTLTVRPADGQGADLALSGAVSVTGGAAVWRDLAGYDGFGDLLAVDPAGAVSMYRGTGTGALSGRIAGTGATFPAGTVLVPSGDTNGDRCNDVYARVGDELRSYRPACGTVVSASSPYASAGRGWGQYDVLTSPGDVNGDGYADLVARQASTGDVYFYAGTADQRLGARVRIGTNWKLYKRIAGAGDLNGDGRGDLLGLDASGVLWRYYGTATGGVTARVRVGGGWGGYSSLVGVGDLNGDGRGDLVAREASTGRLWRYTNPGTGLYAARVMIGAGGWNGFRELH
ncbi:FG-GAP-like repeat-containing protein [Streptomyces sp. NPDC056528]|uniref:FG-GAP-like repeat-containing protein n=1 Tax=Streptomyces sp. NPDC056528 TaxID=3345854 RepID=UPI0036B4F28B